MEGKRILVTGAAGFIGSNLVDALLSQGAVVIGLDNMFNGRMENLESAQKNKKFTFYKGDIRDYDRLLHLMRDIDIVYHEAAFTSVPQSIIMPQLCNDVNVSGTLNILNAARIRDVEKIVFASSSSVYGDTPTLPKHENMKLDPISPYGVAKQAAEAYLVSYNRVYGLNTTALRYFNVFGPRQKDSTYSGVIAIFLAQIFEGKNPIIFGDGKQSRDFTYVKDVVRANILAGLSKETAGKVLNIAAGKPIGLTELTKIMIQESGKKNIDIEYTSVRNGDILHSYGDMNLAKQLLGYEAQYDAVSGFKEYLDYYKAKFNL
ncbi:GDP-mannose 4,6-dehydratase [Candidatus Lokiarchaeum ossiferum]|uniref:GDP-mannose 4,6-dehydratase n=1 Tax=Candidatus Lokiarchaeum ossiferum TaxID=2951803 RepID=A0ABY6HWY8_9ARCH|nr:GDP-mannose 4,6-dehydratase [Candidatus Lokiarchaeum sp. B-35]